MLLNSTKQDKERGFQYAIWNLQHLKLEHDNLPKLRTARLRCFRSLDMPCPPLMKRQRFRECVQGSTKLKKYIEDYDDAEEGH